MKKWISSLLLLTSIFTFSALTFAGDPPAKSQCEKCYRGPDGKIKCDPIPCPKK
ncbi:MAG: hypothetical protein JNK65_09355 [Deltaproteobacteria bacterium]|nr:hypothetical protein [Deltaproteobacteria bacterium]